MVDASDGGDTASNQSAYAVAEVATNHYTEVLVGRRQASTPGSSPKTNQEGRRHGERANEAAAFI